MKKINKEVTEEEFTERINNYPNKLNVDTCGIRDSPLRTYNDFSEGKVWPESVVAWISMDWLGPNGETDHKTNRFFKYYIKM